MMRGTGAPTGQRSRTQTGRAAVVAAVLTLSCLGARPATDDSPTTPRNLELERSTDLIVKAFRTEKPEPIASLVPVDGKAYVQLSAAGDGGYFSRDQVYFIFNKVFSQNDTVDFKLRRQNHEPHDKKNSKLAEAPTFTFFVGTWKYHRHDGVDAENAIHFLLSMKKGGWALVEIREAQ